MLSKGKAKEKVIKNTPKVWGKLKEKRKKLCKRSLKTNRETKLPQEL